MTVVDIQPDLSNWKPKGKIITKAERLALAAEGLKWCPACRAVKSLAAFASNRSASDGLNPQCKACSSEKKRRYREANREKVAEQGRRWRAANPEKQAEASRRWHEANREKKAEMRRRWREANREKVAEQGRRWRAANPETYAAYAKARHADTMKTARRLKKAAVYFQHRTEYLKPLAAYALRRPRGRVIMFASHTVEALCAWHVGDITLEELQEELRSCQ